MNSVTISVQIWKAHSEELKAFICSKVNHDDLCHDILHDLFLKTTEKEERIRWIERPASYLIKMAQNTIIDYYRSQKKTVLNCCTKDIIHRGKVQSSTGKEYAERKNFGLLPLPI